MQVKYSIFGMNNVYFFHMMCFDGQELLSVFSFASRSRDIHYDKHNFFLVKSTFIARHETRNFKLP